MLRYGGGFAANGEIINLLQKVDEFAVAGRDICLAER